MTGLTSTHEAELTAGVEITPGRRYGFFTDTTLCIGCKACEVACKTWNNLPADGIGLSGMSYDNTRELSSNTWRHVKFVERINSAPPRREGQGGGGLKGKEVSEENLGFPLNCLPGPRPAVPGVRTSIVRKRRPASCGPGRVRRTVRSLRRR